MIIDMHTHVFPEIRGLARSHPFQPFYDENGRLVRVRWPAQGNSNEDLSSSSDNDIISSLKPGDKAIYTPEMLIDSMDWAGVDKAVLLQGPAYGEFNNYVSNAVQRYGDRLVGAASFDPWGTDDRGEVEATLDSSDLRAVKLECSETYGFCAIHANARLDMPEISWLWDVLAQRRMILVLDLGAIGSRSYQTNAVRNIALEHPALKIVICHLAQPNPAAEADADLMRAWTEQIDLGKLDNVWFGTSSLPVYVYHEGHPYPSAQRYLRMAIERIGPAHIMWGSDAPGTLLRLA